MDDLIDSNCKLDSWVDDVASVIVAEATVDAIDFGGYSDSDCESDHPCPDTKPRKSPRINMAKLGLVTLSLTVVIWLFISAIQSASQNTILNARVPRPFFSNASREFLDDYYDGQFRVEKSLQNSRITIVMYYAHWCRQSINMGRTFETIARLYKPQNIRVNFAAVNCFTHQGECRRTYKLYSFPVIVAYSANVYTLYQGEHTKDHLFRWIESLLSPVVYLSDEQTAIDFSLNHHYVVVGYFPLQQLSLLPEYRRYLAAAFKSATGFPDDDDLGFGVITSSELAERLGMAVNDITMFTQSGSRHPFEYDITAENIIDWCKSHRDSSSAINWLSFDANTLLKSHLLHDLLNSSAVLVMVTDHELLYPGQADINMLAKIAGEYWDCHSTEPDTIHLSVNTREKAIDEDVQRCAETYITYTEALTCCFSKWNSTYLNELCDSGMHIEWETEATDGNASDKLEIWANTHRIERTGACNLTQQFVAADAVFSKCCVEMTRRGIPTEVNTQYSRVLNTRNLHSCARVALARHMRYNKAGFPEDYTVPTTANNVLGFGCKYSNQSLKFAAIDRNIYHNLLNQWGMNNENMAIIDVKRERFHALDRKITGWTMRNFIREYHTGGLEEIMLSEETMDIHFTGGRPGNDPIPKGRGETVTIQRLTQETFESATTNPNATIVVFFSGGNWHGPSASTLHIYHSVARELSEHKEYLKFYMIDTSRNELPYNFNFESYPAVVVFSKESVDLSWTFPSDVPFTLSNLLSFILTHGGHQLRWRVAFENCDKRCINTNIRRLSRYSNWLTREVRQYRASLEQTIDPVVHYHMQLIVNRRLSQFVSLRATLGLLRLLLHLDNVDGRDAVSVHLTRDDVIRCLPMPHLPSLD